MPKERWKTIFYVAERDGKYKMIYDQELDSTEIVHKLPGALFVIMKQFPELIEEIIYACTQAAEDIAQPFKDILNEKD